MSRNNQFNNPWTPQQLEYLKLNYGKISSVLIAKTLNRTYNAVKIKADRLNLSHIREKPWARLSIEEVERRLKKSGITLVDDYIGTAHKKKHKILCPFCKEIKVCNLRHLLNQDDKIHSCGCVSMKHRKGGIYISGTYFSRIKKSARYRKKEFEITLEYIEQLLINQNFECNLTGLPIKLTFNKGWGSTASLDRIDSSRGYVKGNIQWLHKDINRMKQVYTNKYFIEMCKLVAENQKTPQVQAAGA